jgi:hypothetical protein
LEIEAMNTLKHVFLVALERRLEKPILAIERVFDECDMHSSADPAFVEFANSVHSCLRELKRIRAAIGDKADEIGGAS